MNVAVIVPTRDRCELLPRALDSVRAQTLPAREVIVVDDGSRDGTDEMLRRDYPEVTVLEQRPAGVSAARNRGIAHSDCGWLAFLDSDDAWLPDKLARQAAALREEPEALVCHTDEIWVRRGRRVNPKKKHAKHGGRIYERCLPLCCMSPSSVLLHRRVLDDVGGFDEALPTCEDYDLWLRITCRYPVLLIDEPLVVKHGGHADQLSARHWGMDRFRVRALEKVLAGGTLSAAQAAATRRELRRKLDILRRGAAKRGRHEAAAAYEARSRAHGLRDGPSQCREERHDVAAG